MSNARSGNHICILTTLAFACTEPLSAGETGADGSDGGDESESGQEDGETGSDDGDIPPEARIAGAVNLSHATGAERPEEFVGAEAGPNIDTHWSSR